MTAPNTDPTRMLVAASREQLRIRAVGLLPVAALLGMAGGFAVIGLRESVVARLLVIMGIGGGVSTVAISAGAFLARAALDVDAFDHHRLRLARSLLWTSYAIVAAAAGTTIVVGLLSPVKEAGSAVITCTVLASVALQTGAVFRVIRPLRSR